MGGGGFGVPALHEKRKEHGSVPASRSPGNSLKLAMSVAPVEDHLLRFEGAVSVWIDEASRCKTYSSSRF